MVKNKGINNIDLKQKNRGLLLRLLATGDSNTRIALSKSSHLTKMSVTNIIEEFINYRLIQEGQIELQQETRGKKAVTLQFSSTAPKIIGLLINREYCSAVLCDFTLNVLHTETVQLNCCDKETFLDIIYSLIENILCLEKNILGIGVASIGPLDVTQGIILNPPRFHNIQNIPLVNLLQDKFNLPVFIDHQYNAAARAEKLFGIGKSFVSFIFLGITNGIGAGIYQHDHLLQSNSLGSELGHISINYLGETCGCGIPGCIENYASVNAICKKVQKITGKTLSFKECCDMSNHCTDIDSIISEAMYILSICLVGIVNLLNPEVIIFGHESIFLPERYLHQVEDYINQHKLSGTYNTVLIQKPTFGENTQLVGAACIVLNQVFNGNLLYEETCHNTL